MGAGRLRKWIVRNRAYARWGAATDRCRTANESREARMSETPWEPPFDGTETEHLVGALDRQRATFRWKADGLDRAGLSARIGASDLTIGGLLKHLAFVEDHVSTVRLDGSHPLGPWDPANWEKDEDWEFTSAGEDSPEQLYALYDSCVARARDRVGAALAHGGLDQHVALTGPEDEPASLRRLLCDLLEEYGRHTGHADLLREAVDGRVGEDPPAGWRPEVTAAP
ncbi:DinB family protein [Ornithinicoccus hortensis]